MHKRKNPTEKWWRRKEFLKFLPTKNSNVTIVSSLCFLTHINKTLLFRRNNIINNFSQKKEKSIINEHPRLEHAPKICIYIVPNDFIHSLIYFRKENLLWNRIRGSVKIVFARAVATVLYAHNMKSRCQACIYTLPIWAQRIKSNTLAVVVVFIRSFSFHSML